MLHNAPGSPFLPQSMVISICFAWRLSAFALKKYVAVFINSCIWAVLPRAFSAQIHLCHLGGFLIPPAQRVECSFSYILLYGVDVSQKPTPIPIPTPTPIDFKN